LKLSRLEPGLAPGLAPGLYGVVDADPPVDADPAAAEEEELAPDPFSVTVSSRSEKELDPPRSKSTRPSSVSSSSSELK